MARSLNKVLLIGHLGADPELRYTGSGRPFATFRVATNRSWTDRDGERQEETTWHRVVTWGPTAEACDQYLRKGSPVFVEGYLQTRQWEGNDGKIRYVSEVVAERVIFLGSSGERREG